MIVLFIKIRKLTWLPIKFWLTRNKIINGIEMRSNKEIYERIKEEKTNLLRAERKEVKDPYEIDRYQTILNTLNWIVNDSTKQ